jgi:hypothetical protein
VSLPRTVDLIGGPDTLGSREGKNEPGGLGRSSPRGLLVWRWPPRAKATSQTSQSIRIRLPAACVVAASASLRRPPRRLPRPSPCAARVVSSGRGTGRQGLMAHARAEPGRRDGRFLSVMVTAACGHVHHGMSPSRRGGFRSIELRREPDVPGRLHFG